MKVDPTNNLFTERAETHTFGYAPFLNVSNPDLRTASDRPVYGAINMYRDSVGNLQCGPVAAVLSTRFVGESAIAWPVDTGVSTVSTMLTDVLLGTCKVFPCSEC